MSLNLFKQGQKWFLGQERENLKLCRVVLLQIHHMLIPVLSSFVFVFVCSFASNTSPANTGAEWVITGSVESIEGRLGCVLPFNKTQILQ